MELEDLRDQLETLIVDTARGLRTHLQEMEWRLEAKMDQCFERLDACDQEIAEIRER